MRLIGSLIVVVLLGIGCEEEPVRSYQTPKPRVIDPSGGRSAQLLVDPAAAPARSRLRFSVPGHWQQVDDPSGMRAVSLQAGEGEQAVTITGMSLPSSGFDLASNVARWAGSGQAELITPDPQTLREAVKPFDESGSQQIVQLIGPQKAVTAVIMPRDEGVWFFKMIGPAARVAAEHEAFCAFVRSVEFVQGQDQ